MIIQHNIMALNAHRQLGGNNTMVSKNLEKLSSGFKINRAGDDAAGLAISEKMRAQITGLTRAQANAQDGISLVQTAEGALTEVHSMLNRMVDLATQASNGTIKADDREKVQDEMNALVEEIDRISQSTNFNGINLLDGSLGTGTTGAKVTVGADGTAKNNAFGYSLSGVDAGVTVNFKTVAAADAGDDITAAWSGNTLTFTMKSNDTAFGSTKINQDMIDRAIRNASGAPESASGIKVTLDNDITFSAKSGAQTTAFGSGAAAAAKQASATVGTITFTADTAGARNAAHTIQITATGGSKVGATVNADGTTVVNLSATKEYTSDEINAMLRDAGADVTVAYDGKKTGTQATTAATALANGAGLAASGGLELQIGDTAEVFNKVTVAVDDMGATGLGIKGLSVADQEKASKSIATVKAAINKVSTNRSAMGALQNRLEHTISNLSVATENLTAAESRIRDVDMAKEMMHFTKNNVLSQAAQAMLAQANQQPQQVLQLLR